jgi:exosortase A-associated hydrolase 1
MSAQKAVSFACRGYALFGVLHLPPPGRTAASVAAPKGILIVTGGPQVRTGSHRLFVLLARHLAGLGYPVLRFDYRGMGDSEGARRGYAEIADDLACSIDQFLRSVPGLGGVVMWGLCDGATAAAMYAAEDPRVSGLILLNPWVHTEAGHARATLRHYYWDRLRQAGFWRKLTSGQFSPATAWRSLRQVADAAGLGRTAQARAAQADDVASAPQQLQHGLLAFRGAVLVILSGDDIGAREFDALQHSTAAWRAWRRGPRISQASVAHASHTFSRAGWRDRVAQLCTDWLGSW